LCCFFLNKRNKKSKNSENILFDLAVQSVPPLLWE
jgi:hypothetical protein